MFIYILLIIPSATPSIQDCRLAASTCLNGGVCFYDEKKQTYSCECKPPWTGETCADLCKKQICRVERSCNVLPVEKSLRAVFLLRLCATIEKMQRDGFLQTSKQTSFERYFDEIFSLKVFALFFFCNAHALRDLIRFKSVISQTTLIIYGLKIGRSVAI